MKVKSISSILLLLAAVMVVLVVGSFYHPWEEKLAGTGIFQFENLQAGIDHPGEESLWDRVDLMKVKIYELFFSPSSSSVLTRAAQYVLTPIKDIGESINAAMTYAGLFNSRNPDPLHWGLCLTAYFLLFYGFTWLKTRALSAIPFEITITKESPQKPSGESPQSAAPKGEGKLKITKETVLVKAVDWFIPYSIETIFNFLFLATTFWVMEFLYWVHNGPVYQWYQGCINSSNGLIMVPSLILMVLVMIFLVLLIISGFLSVLAYYTAIALPVLLVSLFPWTSVSVWICVVLEVIVLVKLFPILHEKIDIWKCFMIVTWPVRKIMDLFL